MFGENEGVGKLRVPFANWLMYRKSIDLMCGVFSAANE